MTTANRIARLATMRNTTGRSYKEYTVALCVRGITRPDNTTTVVHDVLAKKGYQHAQYNMSGLIITAFGNRFSTTPDPTPTTAPVERVSITLAAPRRAAFFFAGV